MIAPGEKRSAGWRTERRGVELVVAQTIGGQRSRLGVEIGPPKALAAPKPTSSVMIRRTFGAPSGAVTALGKSGVDSLALRPMTPRNGCSGTGRISELLVAEVCARPAFETDKAAEAAASAEPPSKRCRRVAPSFGRTVEETKEDGLLSSGFDIVSSCLPLAGLAQV
jgi:hypothetical protein